ncbi:MAG: cytochrome c oxidase subunit 4 [Bradymonadia bacterium]|jgi:cytochrome c oxidase subunit 4
MSAHAAQNDAHDDAHDGPHVTPLPIYFAVFGTLLVLTVVTVWIAQFDFGAANTLIAMLVATVKATLVAAIFMHLLYEERLNALAFVFGLLFVSLFFIFTMLDVFTRKHVDPVRANGGLEAGAVSALRLEAEVARNAAAAPVLADGAAVPEDERAVAAPPSVPVVAVATDAPAVKLGLRTQGRRLMLTGTVASEDVLQKVLAAARTAVGEANVASRIRVDATVPTPEWIDALSGAYSAVEGVRGLGVEVAASKVVITGRTDSEESKAQAALAVSAQMKSVPVDNRIEVKRAGDEALERVIALTKDVDGTRYFGENAAELNASAHSTLNALGDMLFEIPSVGIEVGAYADSRTGEKKALSQTRANVVVAYLVKMGIEPKRLKGIGFGPSKAVAGDTAAQNMRIDYVVLGTDGKPHTR